jgi:hypothetical protein
VIAESGGKPRYEGHTSMAALLEWAEHAEFFLAGVYDQDSLLNPALEDSFCNMMFIRKDLLPARQRSRGI